MSEVKLYLGDCLEILPILPEKSVDAILTDLPYGTTACSWDTVIPFEPMWAAVKRVLKPRGVFVTTASQPFTSILIVSNLDWFKYEWIWEKSNPSGYNSCGTMPLKEHENILVFSNGVVAPGNNGRQVVYYPQGLKPYGKSNHRGKRGEITGERPNLKNDYIQEFTNYPRSIISFANGNNGSIHPTQKPVALYEYLTLTYTNPGDTVLDICAGSGTTGVACVKTGRNFIGIEKRQDYFEIMEKRIKEAQMQLVMPI